MLSAKSSSKFQIMKLTAHAQSEAVTGPQPTRDLTDLRAWPIDTSTQFCCTAQNTRILSQTARAWNKLLIYTCQCINGVVHLSTQTWMYIKNAGSLLEGDLGRRWVRMSLPTLGPTQVGLERLLAHNSIVAQSWSSPRFFQTPELYVMEDLLEIIWEYGLLASSVTLIHALHYKGRPGLYFMNSGLQEIWKSSTFTQNVITRCLSISLKVKIKAQIVASLLSSLLKTRRSIFVPIHIHRAHRKANFTTNILSHHACGFAHGVVVLNSFPDGISS